MNDENQTDPVTTPTFVLLRETQAGGVRAFEPTHAAALLAYPGTLWEVAPAGSAAAPVPPLPLPTCYCEREEYADQVEDLCAACPIRTTIHDPASRAHVVKEIEDEREACTSEQFKAYCEKASAHHREVRKQYTNNKHWGWSMIKMEIIFHNQSVAILYRQELEATINSAPIPVAAPKSVKLSLRQVALLHIYQGFAIPTAADSIAHAHGHTSGKRLYELYTRFAHGINNRTGVEGRAIRPMVSDISAVIPLLTGTSRQDAEKELQTLEAKNRH